MSVLGKGKASIFTNSNESLALYVPSFPFQLLSVGKITNSLNCHAMFSPNKVIFQDIITKKMIGEGSLLNDLYYLCKISVMLRAFQAEPKYFEHQQLWHQRLAHPSELVLSKLFPMFCQSPLKCETCSFSKSVRLPFGTSAFKTCKPFEMVHTDVWGPTIESMDGYKFFVIFVDDFTRTTFLYLMKSKSEVFCIFKDFHNLVQTQPLRYLGQTMAPSFYPITWFST